MAACECGREYTDPRGCAFTHVEIAGKTYRRNVSQFDEGSEQQAKCPDCGAPRGKPHHINCDTERCPVCHGQMLGCDCEHVSFVTLAAKEKSPNSARPVAVLDPELVRLVEKLSTSEELVALNDLAKAQWANAKAAAAAGFKIGDRVLLKRTNGQSLTGCIKKINRKNIVMLADDGAGLWNCSPTLLTKVGS